MKKYALKLADDSVAILKKDDDKYQFFSENYKFYFDRKTGFFARWGKTQDDDGDPNLGLPEIADIEISTICNGINGVPCAFCYKANTGNGTYMNLETFKKVFHNLPPTITQIAFGIGDINANPDMWEIFNYCNDNGVVPNVTINGEGMEDYIADKLVEKCGAVAVSLYDKNKTYNAVKKLTDRGLKQTNIHFMLSEETIDRSYQLMEDYKNDPRLEKLNAIVFLSLKKKGRARSHFNQCSKDDFKKIINYAFDNNIPIGFDSCSYHKFADSIKGSDNESNLIQVAESCESSIYSSYINVDGKFFPCSFCEETEGWENGIDVVNTNNFLKDVWYNERTNKFRKNLISCSRKCPLYDI